MIGYLFIFGSINVASHIHPPSKIKFVQDRPLWAGERPSKRFMILAALIDEHEFRMFVALLIKNRLRNTVANQRSPSFASLDVAGWNNKHTAFKFLQEGGRMPS